MKMNDKQNFEVINNIFRHLYELNRKGKYVAFFGYSGHTEQIGITIIKAPWEYDKMRKPIYDALIKTTYGDWRDQLSGQNFDISAFYRVLDSLK